MKKFYVETRREGGESHDSIAISARAIEGLYRLSQASARVKLSSEATIEDAQRAIRLTTLWRHELMGENYDETTLQSGKKATARNRERVILDIVKRIYSETGDIVPLMDVLTEAGRLEISRDVAQDIIDNLCTDGRLMRPRGYDTLQPV